MVGTVDTSRVVDRVGEDPPAIGCELDASTLGEPEVAALTDHLAAQVAAIDSNQVVGLVSRDRMRFLGRLDVGADSAVPQQVDRGLENR